MIEEGLERVEEGEGKKRGGGRRKGEESVSDEGK